MQKHGNIKENVRRKIAFVIEYQLCKICIEKETLDY